MMESISTLLQIIQFVGLIAPALAILLELLVSFYGGIEEMASQRNIPAEVQLLMVGFLLTLLGGMAIGIRLTMRIDSLAIKYPAAMVFLGLPLVAAAVVLFNIQLTEAVDEARGFIELLQLTSSTAAGLLIPFVLVGALWMYPIYKYQDLITSNFSWGIFSSGLSPLLVFILPGIVMTYKLIYVQWESGNLTNPVTKEYLRSYIILFLTIYKFIIILSAPVFIVFGLLSYFRITFFAVDSILMNLPFLWGNLLSFMILTQEFNIENERQRSEPIDNK